MKVITLTENTVCRPDLGSEHGLSLYIEACGHKILFDMGQSDLFVRNAETLGVDLAQVDLAILSHGHFDHGRGLPEFLKINQTAKIFIHKLAGEGHYSARPENRVADIGIAPEWLNDPRVVLTEGTVELFPGAVLFADVTGSELRSPANDTLLIQAGESYVCDPFLHEQSLILTENGHRLLVGGCAHRGIVNILDRALELAGAPMEVVIGGFHMSVPSTGKSIPEELVRAVAARLLEQPGTVYYTCHCTGSEAYATLRDAMGERVQYLAGGGIVEL